MELKKKFNLKPNWIKKVELVGKSLDGFDVYHIVTKGGFHQILKKKKNNDYIVLGYGPHRGVARYMANQLEKNIQWIESLFKSESNNEPEVPQEIKLKFQNHTVSTPENHISQATYHAHQSQRANDNWTKLYHTLRAVSHLNAAGLEHKKALEQFTKILQKLNKNLLMEQPFDEEQLIQSYEIKTRKKFFVGLSNLIYGKKT